MLKQLLKIMRNSLCLSRKEWEGGRRQIIYTAFRVSLLLYEVGLVLVKEKQVVG